MNETIGVKGGHNDRLRSQKIKRQREAKIDEEELLELEKKVKRQQKFTLIKVVPIVLVGGIVNTFSQKDDKKEEVTIKVNDFKEGDSTYEAGNLKEFRENVKEEETEPVKVNIQVYRDDLVRKESVEIENTYREEKKAETGGLGFSLEENVSQESTAIKSYDKTNEFSEEGPVREVKQGFIPMGTNRVVLEKYEDGDIHDSELTISAKDKLNKLKSRKIIEEYEKNLKNIRYELRKLIFEYNVLVEDDDEIILSREAETILDKLSDIVDRISLLKAKIKIEDLNKYDDNYIYTLIEDYLSEFKDKRVVKEIKDSPLYILIEEKLDELDSEKSKLDKKVKSKLDRLEEKEENFEILKERFFNIDKINNDLFNFQMEQEYLLKDVQEKVRNAVSVQEKVQIEVEAMSRQSRKLLNLLTLSLLFPGSRAARGMATTTATYLLFVNGILKPKTISKKYKVVTVKDYSLDIENSINALNDASSLLGKTGKQIDKMTVQIKEEFADYLGVIPEADQLISNLRKIKSEIAEKEYEMEKMKKEQVLLLEKNNAKVKKRGTYPM